MGVVYKLKQEVIDFIVERKKETPKIGCRKLAELTGGTFQVVVSKSSVSTVLKNANLSSAVGRRTKSPNDPKSFYIPRKKKEQIFNDLQKSPFLTKEKVQKEKKFPVLPKEQEKKEPLLAHSPLFPEKKKIEPDFVKREQLRQAHKNIRKDAVLSTREYEPIVKQEAQEAGESKKSEQLISSLGCVFIKAAQWMLSADDLLGDFVKKYTAQPTPDNIYEICNAAMFLKKFPRPKDIAPDKWGPAMLNLHCEYSEEETEALFEQPLQSLNKQIVEFSSRITSLSLMVSGFHLVLENGEDLFLDSELRTCAKRIMSTDKTPVLQALTFLSKNVVSNNLPICLNMDSSPQNIDTLQQFISFANNEDGFSLKEISVLDEKTEKIASFSVVPSCKKNFIVGFSEKHKEYQSLTKATKWAKKKEFLCKNTGAKLFFTDTYSDLMSGEKEQSPENHRVLALWGDSRKIPKMALFTNDKESAPEPLINAYILRWPEVLVNTPIRKGKEGPMSTENSERQQLASISGHSLQCLASGQFDLVGCFCDLLEEYAAKWFFEGRLDRDAIKHLISTCCEIPGTLEAKREAIFVKLQLKKTDPYLSEILAGLRKVNDFNILDSLGRRLILDSYLKG